MRIYTYFDRLISDDQLDASKYEREKVPLPYEKYLNVDPYNYYIEHTRYHLCHKSTMQSEFTDKAGEPTCLLYNGSNTIFFINKYGNFGYLLFRACLKKISPCAI